MRKMLDFLKTSWGRMAAGITAMLAVAWLNDGQITGKVDWDATTAFAVAVLAWFYGCLPVCRYNQTTTTVWYRRARHAIGYGDRLLSLGAQLGHDWNVRV